MSFDCARKIICLGAGVQVGGWGLFGGDTRKHPLLTSSCTRRRDKISFTWGPKFGVHGLLDWHGFVINRPPHSTAHIHTFVANLAESNQSNPAPSITFWEVWWEYLPISVKRQMIHLQLSFTILPCFSVHNIVWFNHCCFHCPSWNKLASLEAMLVQNYTPPTELTGVKCRATTAAKNP